MSYILEALKKAQTERQLGSTPGLNALPIQAAPESGVARSVPLWGALAAVVAIATAAGVFVWRQTATPPAPVGVVGAAGAKPPAQTGAAPVAPSAGVPASAVPVAAPALTPTVAPASTPTVAPAPSASAAPAPTSAMPEPARASATVPSSVSPTALAFASAPPAGAPQAASASARVTPAPAAAPARAPETARGGGSAHASDPASARAEPATAPLTSSAASRGTAATPVADTAPDDTLPSSRALPAAVLRQLPQVAFGGYIYSKNPEDRLLLVDKVLRHEGEEVAPGLVLEKLLPKAAVMNFKGYRYRVAY